MMSEQESYSLSPLPVFGVEVTGIDLKRQTPPEVVDRIRRDVTEHRLMVFRDQGLISGDRQVEISQWFGELDSAFRKHPRSPHPDVFRVSNESSEGCTGIGEDWHLDGTFRAAPHSHSLYHIHSVSSEGDTAFAPLNEVVRSLSEEQRAKWGRLHTVRGVKRKLPILGDFFQFKDTRQEYIHPLVWHHPLTQAEVLSLIGCQWREHLLKTLCFHLGMTTHFIYNFGLRDSRATPKRETRQLIEEIRSQITREEGRHIYHHKWTYGDFIISDNLAVGHEATPQTQYSASQVGLRVLHRTTVKGVHRPGS